MKDSNTTPYANAVELSGTNLYVMLQRRNGYKPGAPTLILKINTLTEAIVDTIPLKYKDGYAMEAVDGMLYVTNPGSSYSIGDGGIEVVNLSDNTVKEIVSETLLGGNPNNIAHKSGTIFYVTNYIGWKNIQVLEIDLSTGTVLATLPGVKDAFGGICYDKKDGTLYVGERDSLDCGIRIFKNNMQQGSVVKGAKGLPPTSLAVINEQE
jgi:DNA-binding beta-propeller fold protein YncE